MQKLLCWWVYSLVLVLPGFSTPLMAGEPQQKTAENISDSFNKVAKVATPSVVGISAVKVRTAADLEGELPFGLPPHAFEGEPGDNSDGKAEGGLGGLDQPPSESIGVGSGVIIRGDGIVLTNNHVVENAERITVTMGADDKQKYSAKVIGSDTKTDIAVLKLEKAPANLPIIQFGDSNKVQVGDWALAIGNPFGLSHTMTAGIVSAKGRAKMGVFDIEDFIQTDVPINPGNSGGPLLNIKGEMVGLNAAIFSQGGGFIGIGFSIPSNLLRQISNEIVQNGRVIRGWMGVVAQDLDADLTKYFKVPEGKGALISSVQAGGPAAGAKVEPGDVVTKFGGQPVTNSTDLRTLVTKAKAGEKLPVTLIRDGQAKDVQVAIREQPQPKKRTQQAAGQAAKETKQPSFGLVLEDVPEEFSKFFGVPSDGGALVTSIRPGSPAFEAGISPGDIILRANDKKIRSAKDFVSFSKKVSDQDTAVLYVQRGPDKKIFVPVKHHA